MTMVIIIFVVLAVLVVAGLVARFVIKRGKRRDYPDLVRKKWLDIQRLCSKKETWPQAIMSADKLLEEALKSKKFKGKSIGERLVAAQRKLSDNDGVWYAHNLAKKLKEKNVKRLREADVKKALVGFRQALRDLGVLNGK